MRLLPLLSQNGQACVSIRGVSVLNYLDIILSGMKYALDLKVLSLVSASICYFKMEDQQPEQSCYHKDKRFLE